MGSVPRPSNDPTLKFYEFSGHRTYTQLVMLYPLLRSMFFWHMVRGAFDIDLTQELSVLKWSAVTVAALVETV